MEANDAVTVASMNRPKPLPNEVLSDFAVSAATKLQCFRVILVFLSFLCFSQCRCNSSDVHGIFIRIRSMMLN